MTLRPEQAGCARPESLSDDDVLALIRTALCEVLPDRAYGSMRLQMQTGIDELGIDSVREMEMVGWIEDRLARTFTEVELSKAVTLGDLASLIRTGKVQK